MRQSKQIAIGFITVMMLISSGNAFADDKKENKNEKKGVVTQNKDIDSKVISVNKVLENLKNRKNIRILEIELKNKNNHHFYEIELIDGNILWKYRYDAINGKLIYSSQKNSEKTDKVKIVELEKIISIVQNSFSGKIIEVKLEEKKSKLFYEVEIIEKNGNIRELIYNAFDGKLEKSKD